MRTPSDKPPSTRPPGSPRRAHSSYGEEPSGAEPGWEFPLESSGADAGPGTIDSTIEALLRCIEEASLPAIRVATTALDQELTAHMAREEAAMRRSSYPLAEGHEEAHDLLLEKVREFLRQSASDAAAPESRRTAVREIATRFHAHVAAYDFGLAGFLGRSRSA